MITVKYIIINCWLCCDTNWEEAWVEWQLRTKCQVLNVGGKKYKKMNCFYCWQNDSNCKEKLGSLLIVDCRMTATKKKLDF